MPRATRCVICWSPELRNSMVTTCEDPICIKERCLRNQRIRRSGIGLDLGDNEPRRFDPKTAAALAKRLGRRGLV